MTAPSPARLLKSLCVFCGSQPGKNPAFGMEAKALGEAMARENVALVYGGGRMGLMGVVADAVLDGGGRAIGVIPDFLKDKELAHASATEMVVVPDMHTRKRMMFERADAFCILPGGIGTLDEFFEIVTWRQLNRHNKPIIILNTANYWNPLLALFAGTVTEGFAHRRPEELLNVVNHAADVLDAVEQELAQPKPTVFLSF